MFGEQRVRERDMGKKRKKRSISIRPYQVKRATTTRPATGYVAEKHKRKCDAFREQLKLARVM